MANSLNFLNKPVTPAATKQPYGPQPKPASSSAAAKPFFDLSNPWNVNKASTAAPKPINFQTVVKTQSKAAPAKKTNIPTRGYNYTDASYTGKPAYERAREVDQATMSGQAAGERRAAQAAAQPQPQPIPVVAPRPIANQVPVAAIVPPTAYLAPAVMSLAQRAMNRWVQAMGGEPAQPEQRRMAPTAEQALAQRAMQPANGQRSIPVLAPEGLGQMVQSGLAAAGNALTGGQAPASDTWTVGWRPPGSAPAAQPAGTQPAAPRSPTGQATPAAQTPAPQAGTGALTKEQLFYGYPAPGPIRGDYGLPASQSFTTIGMRAQLPDAAIAAEDARRQRQTAGWTPASYRPWNSLTDAEKYQRRFGVAPRGPQMRTDYSAADAAYARMNAQHDQLLDEFWDRYRNYYSWVESPMWARQPDVVRPEEPIQRDPSGRPAGAAQRQAPTAVQTQNNQGAVWQPVTTRTTGQWQPTPGVTQDQLNTDWVMRYNPKVRETGVPEEEDLHAVAREIIGRYVADLDTSTLSLPEIVYMMAELYKPPPGMERPYGEDLKWLNDFLSE